MREKTDDDYVRLDDAIAALLDWEQEIIAELAKRDVSERCLHDVLAACHRVHSPEEE